jgi:hypothetical protein
MRRSSVSVDNATRSQSKSERKILLIRAPLIDSKPIAECSRGAGSKRRRSLQHTCTVWGRRSADADAIIFPKWGTFLGKCPTNPKRPRCATSSEKFPDGTPIEKPLGVRVRGYEFESAARRADPVVDHEFPVDPEPCPVWCRRLGERRDLAPSQGPGPACG